MTEKLLCRARGTLSDSNSVIDLLQWRKGLSLNMSDSRRGRINTEVNLENGTKGRARKRRSKA